MATLNFNPTCPTINQNINYFKSDLHSVLYNELEPHSELSGVDLDAEIAKKVEEYYQNVFQQYFEGLRTLNSDMREQAEKQLGDLENEVSDLKSEIEDLLSKIEDLEGIIRNH